MSDSKELQAAGTGIKSASHRMPLGVMFAPSIRGEAGYCDAPYGSRAVTFARPSRPTPRAAITPTLPFYLTPRSDSCRSLRSLIYPQNKELVGGV